MRILVATDLQGDLGSLEAGEAIARGWQAADPTAELAVAPLGAAGEGFLSSVRLDADERAVTAHPREVAGALLDRPRRLLVDLGTVPAGTHDAGEALLAGLGAEVTRGDGGARVDLSRARDLVGDTELVGVVAAGGLERHLLGLRGITAVRGRETGEDPATMLATDSALEAFTMAVGRTPEPGDGAAGGTAYAITALGGRLVEGPAECVRRLELPATARVADLVITGTTSFDFGSRGGGVVREVADVAQAALTPCIVLAERVLIAGREMRTMGVESAYAAEGPGAAELEALAARVARTWRW
ncbi:glycerate kinase [Mariniluteicoccus endophyticus]